MRYFDTHLHADCRSSDDFETMALLGMEYVVAVAGESAGYRCGASLLDYYARLIEVDMPRMARSSIRPLLGLGIHPRGIPRESVEEVYEALPDLFGREDVVAVGEIGLEKGDEPEQRVLRRLIAIGMELDLPFIVHTPRKRKGAVTEVLVTVLRSTGVDPNRVVVDHVTRENVIMVEEFGAWKGVTIHPAKLAPAEAAVLLAEKGMKRVLVNSDLGAAPSWLYALPMLAVEMRKLGIPYEEVERVMYHNPKAFFGIGERNET